MTTDRPDRPDRDVLGETLTPAAWKWVSLEEAHRELWRIEADQIIARLAEAG